MGIENFNRFHWMIIGALFGAAMAYTWVGYAQTLPLATRREPTIFENEIATKEPKSGTPLISGIVVHPPQYSPPDKGNINVVTYKRLAQDKDGKHWWLDRWIIAKIPYKPAYRPVGNDPNMDIQGYLTELSKRNELNFIQFKDGWWLKPANAMAIGAGAGIVLIGGVWPTLLGVMMGAGLGPKRDTRTAKQKADEKKAASLWRYKSKSGPAPSGGRKKVITEADRAALQNVTDAYASGLQPDGTRREGVETVATAEKTEEVRKLDANPLEQVAVQAEEDSVEVQNREYYPTLVHHKKDDKAADHPTNKH